MKNDLPQSITKLIGLIEAEDEITNSILKAFVISCNIRESDILPYADYSHKNSVSYGRNIVFDGGRFKILVITWNPGDFSAVHSHGFIEWGIIKYFGEGQKNLYNIDHDLLTLYKIQTMTNGSYEEVTNDLIHQTGNNSDAPLLSLHVYGSNRRSNEITYGTEVFDLEKEQIFITAGEAYLSTPRHLIHKTAPCPLPDKDTFVYNAILMLRFLNKQKDISHSGWIDDLLLRMIEYYG
ncbi:MAG: cysteine dioxygenase family protein [Bacteroidetes bacterium]|nr:cysteine dioxygenase family protein [Bacteroidota bacterium]